MKKALNKQEIEFIIDKDYKERLESELDNDRDEFYGCFAITEPELYDDDEFYHRQEQKDAWETFNSFNIEPYDENFTQTIELVPDRRKITRSRI